MIEKDIFTCINNKLIQLLYIQLTASSMNILSSAFALFSTGVMWNKLQAEPSHIDIEWNSLVFLPTICTVIPKKLLKKVDNSL